MAIMDDEPAKKPKAHLVGQDISLMSKGELQEAIIALRTEIARLEAAIAAREGTRATADSLFKF
jgi:uncharacterized small protein (DUF1192 family)